MKKRNPVNNGHLTGMSQEEILADVLSHILKLEIASITIRITHQMGQTISIHLMKI